MNRFTPRVRRARLIAALARLEGRTLAEPEASLAGDRAHRRDKALLTRVANMDRVGVPRGTMIGSGGGRES